jgi:hypothetical protein
MPLYEIALIVAVILFTALALMQLMRQQVHQARFDNQQISPWDVRCSNSIFGQYGIWMLHKGAYQRSGLRLSFLAVLLALLVSLVVGFWHFFYVAPRLLNSDLASPFTLIELRIPSQPRKNRPFAVRNPRKLTSDKLCYCSLTGRVEPA